MTSTLIKVEIGAEIKKGTRLRGRAGGVERQCVCLRRLGAGGRREDTRNSSRETLPTVGILPHKRTVKSGSKPNKKITDTAAVRPLPTRRVEF